MSPTVDDIAQLRTGPLRHGRHRQRGTGSGRDGGHVDDPWQHVTRLEARAPGRYGLSDRVVSILFVASIVLLALMPILIVAVVWIMLVVTR